MKTTHFFKSTTVKALSLLFLCSVISISCSDDDPQPINEEEVITRIVLTFTSPGGLEEVYTYDVDGEAPEIVLENAITYDVNIAFENASNPENIKDVTEDIIIEADDHHVFYQINEASIMIDNAINDIIDTDENPLGIRTLWNTTGFDNGSVTVYLIHEPTKKEGTVRDDFGGEDDVQLTFNISIAP